MPVVEVFVLDHAYYVASQDSMFDAPEALGGTGLVASSDSTAMVLCGTDTGPLLLEVISLPGRPVSGWPPEAWEEVAEASIIADGGVVVGGGDSSPQPDLPALPGEGPVRLRVHARGRDGAAAGDVVVSEPVEAHLILLWPEASSPAVLIRSTDAFGDAFGRVAR